MILDGKCSYPVDIWALGCTFFEILTNKLLFNPKKNNNFSRDYYHLCLINDYIGDYPSEFLKTTKDANDYFKNNIIIDYEKDENNNMEDSINNLNLSPNDKVEIIGLLKMMLVINPNNRCSIKNLINHSFFT